MEAVCLIKEASENLELPERKVDSFIRVECQTLCREGSIPQGERGDQSRECKVSRGAKRSERR